jgi:hypothetical protein
VERIKQVDGRTMSEELQGEVRPMSSVTHKGGRGAIYIFYQNLAIWNARAAVRIYLYY